MAASLSSPKMEFQNPDFDKTTDEFEELLDTKLTTFTRYTGELLNLCVHLVQNKIISAEERDEINAATTDSKKVLQLVAFFRKKGFNSIPAISYSYRQTRNATIVPDLLDDFWKCKVLPRLNPANTTSEQTPTTDSANSNLGQDKLFSNQVPLSNDFEVTDSHNGAIAGILLTTLSRNHWDVIKQKWLPSAVRNEIGQHSSMEMDILKTLEEWIRRTKEKDRVFSKFIKVFDGYESTKEALIKWKDSKFS